MREVIVVCEGQTEREFCRRVLAPHFAAGGIAVSGTLVGKPQRKRGGIRDWLVYREELLRLGKERDDRHLAVLVDYYGMPDSWPGRPDSMMIPIERRGLHVEEALHIDLEAELPGRFHPCIQLHEFESLLFVDPEIASLSIAIGGGTSDHVVVARQMSGIKAQCGGSVEQIDDSPQTAPSKRLRVIVPGYDKVAWGITAAADISIAVLRAGCPWLDRWMSRISSLEGV